MNKMTLKLLVILSLLTLSSAAPGAVLHGSPSVYAAPTVYAPGTRQLYNAQTVYGDSVSGYNVAPLVSTGAVSSVPVLTSGVSNIYTAPILSDLGAVYSGQLVASDLGTVYSAPLYHNGATLINPNVQTVYGSGAVFQSAPLVQAATLVQAAPVVQSAPVVRTAPVVQNTPVVQTGSVLQTAPVIRKAAVAATPVKSNVVNKVSTSPLSYNTYAHPYSFASPYSNLLPKLNL